MFDLLDQYQVNELHVRNDLNSGLKAFIAIHNTDLGPALGGCRFISYPNNESAFKDVLSLARGMSYKAALSGLPQGGGKAVIIKPKGRYDHYALFKEFGRFVESLNGQYITAIDSGTSAREMDTIASQTSHVTSTSSAGNPSKYTAHGVLSGLLSGVRFKLGTTSLHGLGVAIQGVGNVGFELGKMLANAGAEVTIADVDPNKVDQAKRAFSCKVVSPSEIHACDCDVFSPCGLSNVINQRSVSELRCLVIAGSANVQLEDDHLGGVLHERGILYAPDYVINAGGLIYASLTHEMNLYGGDKTNLIKKKIAAIGDTLNCIYQRSESENLPTNVVSEALAKEIIFRKHDQAA